MNRKYLKPEIDIFETIGTECSIMQSSTAVEGGAVIDDFTDDGNDF